MSAAPPRPTAGGRAPEASGVRPPAQRPTLAACTIAKDEARDLPRWLGAMLRFCDEAVVVVDASTTDGTRGVLREAEAAHPGRVRWAERAMTDAEGFSGLRNACIGLATADWLLHTDADERPTPELARSAREAIGGASGGGASGGGALNAFRYRRLNHFLHRPMDAGGWQGWNRPQLARRGAHRFTRRIHEAVVVEGGEAATGQLRGRMWHLADADYAERVGKNAHYMQKTATDILARGLRVRWYHLLGHPLWRGLRAYALKGAWREGTRGLLFALYTAASTFNWWATAWDRQNRVGRDALEAELDALWAASGPSPEAASEAPPEAAPRR